MKSGKKRALGWLVMMIATCLNPSAFAASQAGAMTLSLAGGYDFFSSKRYVKNTGVPYAILGYNFTQQWGIEGMLGYISSHPKNSSDHRNVRGGLAAVDGVYRFSAYHFIEPFLLAGIGAIGLNPNGNQANDQGNLNAGAGALLFVNDIMAFRVEARDFYTITGGMNDVFLGAGITFVWC